MKLKIFITVIIAFMALGSQAQETINSRHEISIGLGGGISSLQYKSDIATQSMGFGGQAGLGYTFFFNKNWGITTGVDFNLFNAKASLDNGFERSYNSTSQGGLHPGEAFTFTYSLNNYEETQQALYLSIPLMLQYQTNGKNKFYAAVGGKIGFPISATYKTESYELSTKGYFPSDGRMYDDLPQYGFGQYTQSSKGDLDLGMAFFASIETGIKWTMGKKNALYTGIYLDYGLNNIQDVNNQTFVAYSESNDQQVNSLVQSQTNGQAITDKISPLAFGLKVKFAFGCGEIKSKQKVEPQPAVVKQEPIKDNSEALTAEQTRKKAEAERLAQEEANRKVAEQQRLTQEKEAQQATKNNIQQPVENYELSQVSLSSQQKQELDEKVMLLQQNQNMKFYIYGHTCDLGGDVVNEKIGLQRAEKAKEYLVSKGIAANRIIGVASKRDTEPLLPNTNEENRKQNRRVEVKVVE